MKPGVKTISLLLDELEALRCATMMLFLESAHTDSDGSYHDAIEHAGEVLRAFTVAAPTLEEFTARLQETLSLPPEDFLARLKEVKQAQQARYLTTGAHEQ